MARNEIMALVAAVTNGRIQLYAVIFCVLYQFLPEVQAQSNSAIEKLPMCKIRTKDGVIDLSPLKHK